ncbi:hypothetical protein [Paenibacillus sp. SAF-068]|uniref:hypothetical protein n=1 Tax=Paenibacillus sp. SAF-068 TaxID=3436864 RepID=UPI003F815D2E
MVVPRVVNWLSRLRVTEPVLTIALVFCFPFAYFGEKITDDDIDLLEKYLAECFDQKDR